MKKIVLDKRPMTNLSERLRDTKDLLIYIYIYIYIYI